MEKRWTIKPPGNPEEVQHLAGELDIPNVLADLLVQRGIRTYEEAKQFFRPELSELHDPFLMKDMDIAVARIEEAIEKGEKILIYGDYDVDGTTAVSLLYSFLSGFYDKLDYYIPDRYTEGYGISTEGIDHAKANGFSLIISLDCGIKAKEKIAYAGTSGIDFIVCDHHLPEEELPPAVAVLDPKRVDCSYPFDELSGCGVGFKLVQAIAQKRSIPFEELEQYLDLVAISIACDIVPMTGENRILTHHGLKRLNEKPRIGIRKLLELSQVKKELSVGDLVFIIGPRINAAGRVKHAKKAVELLISGDEETAVMAAQCINEYNMQRKEIDKSITAHALSMIEQNPELSDTKTTVLYHEEWHKGVIGIVASRLIERYYRPTVVLTQSNGMATGSARSVRGFDLYRAIEACSDLLEQFGGHKYAAGLTLKIEQIPAFTKKFEQVVNETIDEKLLTPEILVDAELDFSEISPKFYRILKQFAPFGPENMRPVFVTTDVMDAGYSKKVGEDGAHLKLDAVQPHKGEYGISGIAFNLGKHYENISREGELFDIVYTVDENVWNDRTSLQLKVKDIRV